MVSKRQLNSSKRCLKETMKETNEFVEQCTEKNSWNFITTKTQKENLQEKLNQYQKELMEFGETLPENEESDLLFQNYEDVYIVGEKLAKSLQVKINELKELKDAEEREREREILQVEKEREREILQAEKEREREREMKLNLERMKLEHEERITLEKLNVEKLTIEAEIKQRSLEIDKETKLMELENATIKVDKTAKGNVKLPKLELVKFDGDIFRWQEFWDSFEATIHKANSLCNIEKFNYLRAQLRSEAKEAITGLETTEANYNVAIDILHERYGNKQLIINAHYTKLKEMPISSSYYEKLRTTYDNIEKHLRSLEALGENVDNNLMMSLIQSKFPKNVLARLEEYKNDNNPWSVALFRREIKRYIAAQEIGNRMANLNSNSQSKHNEIQKQAQYQRQPTAAFQIGERQRKCIYCEKGHWSDECTDFTDIPSRKKQISGRCYICLKTGHLLKECQSTRKCVYCNQERNHHRSLCPKQFKSADNIKQTSMVAIGEQVIMQTATVELVNPIRETFETTRLLLDCGSQRSYITEDLAKRLKLHYIGKNYLTIYTFGTTKPKEIETSIVELGIQLKSGFIMNIKANVVPNVTGEIERRPIKSIDIKKKLLAYQLADDLPTSIESNKIHLLIGNDYYTDIVSLKRIEITDTLHLISSKVGWILTGRLKSENSMSNDFTLLSSSRSSISTERLVFPEDQSVKEMEPNLNEFWKLETIGIKETITETADDKILEDFNESVRKINGRYHVKWPWKNEYPDLPENYTLAYGRLKSTIKRLTNNDKNFLDSYDDIINNQLKKGIIEKIDDKHLSNGSVHYIPHHAVMTPSKSTTKIRIVYDASAKSRKGNQSLNECMHRGPVLIEDLCGLLLRFRTNKIALVADIEKAFLQIALQETERDVTRFLWLKNPKKPVTEDNIQIYRFSRVPFGVIASPFLLSGSIQHHLKDIGTKTALKISKELYVDNLVSGEATPTKAVKEYQESKEIFKDISMNLREWASNSQYVMKQIPEEDHAKGDKIRVLGLNWKIRKDTLNIVHKDQTASEPTKRHILKTTAGVFDPLGLFTPVTLQSKLLLRELWEDNKGWDEKITTEQRQTWISIQQDLVELSTVKIPRYVGNENCKLLCFCDASGQAYATVIYLLTEKDGDRNVNLIFSKSRIVPNKPTTIPRLELLAVLIGTRSLKFIEETLGVQIKEKVLWTDSTCVLNWIKSTKPLPTFVENRLKEIKKHEDIQFRYVNTKENPADMASRGKTLRDLRNDELWWHGPNWLQKMEDSWPHWEVPIINKEVLENLAKMEKEPKILYEVSNIAGDGPPEEKPDRSLKNISPYDIKLEKFSSYQRLIRTTAWVTRFIKNVSKKGKIETNLTSREIKESEFMWIKFIQRQDDRKETNKLNLQHDQEGIIRCYGRLPNMETEESPIYLPKKNYFTNLVIKDSHEKLFHAGASHTLSHIRRKYWIPHGRTQVRSILLKCGTCKRFQGSPFKMPRMSSWPTSKVTRSAPFSHTGLDYMGPLYIKEADKKRKVWICLFTCVTTRALHLEIVDDMTAEQFLMGLRRFISRRGTPSEIICDNAKQFKATKTVIDQAWKKILTDPSVYNYVSSKGIEWNFIIEFSPWSGGFYERLVGLVKSSLRKSIGLICLTKTQLTTITTEIEATLNSRPLTYVDEDINSSNPVTPNHFLTPFAKVGLPTLDNQMENEEFKPRRESTAENLISIWKKGQSHLNRYWKVWYSHYILSLRERYRTHIKESKSTSKFEPKIKDIVHIKEDLPRGRWKLGRIEEMITSNDGQIRAAKVRTSNGNILKRPLNLLYPMELMETKEIISDEPKTINEEDKDAPNQRKNVRQSQRESAKNAKLKIKLQYDDEEQ